MLKWIFFFIFYLIKSIEIIKIFNFFLHRGKELTLLFNNLLLIDYYYMSKKKKNKNKKII